MTSRSMTAPIKLGVVKSFAAAMALLSLSVACTQSRTSTTHEGPAEGRTVVNAKKDQQKSGTAQTPTSAANSDTSTDSTTAPAKPGELDTLVNSVLSKSRLEKTEYTTSNEAKANLSRLNGLIISLLKDQPSKETSIVLQRYIETALYGCDENLNHCKFVAFFSTDFRSATILNWMVRNSDSSDNDLDRPARLLLLAFEVKNRISHPELDESLFAMAETTSQIKNAGLKAKFLQILRFKIRESMEETGSQNKDANFSWILKLQPLRTSRVAIDTDSPLSSIHEERTLLIGRAINMLKANGQLDAAIRAAADLNPKNFRAELSRIQAEMPTLLGRLGIDQEMKSSTSEDAVMDFFVDRLYTQDLSSADVLLALRQIDFKPQHLVNSIRKIIRVRFAVALMETTTSMRDFYKNVDNLGSDQVVQSAITKSQDSRPHWVRLITRSEELSTLAFTALKSEKIDPEVGRQLSQEVSAMVSDLPRQIKSASVVPQMIILAYILSQTGFEKTFQAIWFSVDINSSKVLGELFSGKASPWFNYGNDRKEISREEIVLGFKYALVTGAMQAFKVDPVKLLTMFYDRTVAKITTSTVRYSYDDGGTPDGPLLQTLTYLRRLNAAAAADKSVVNDLCRIAKGEIQAESISRHSNLDELEYSTFLGSAGSNYVSNTKPMTDSVKGILVFNSRISQGLESIRLGVRPLLTMYSQMAEIYRQDQISQGVSQAQVDAKLAPLQTRIDGANRLTNDFVKEVLSRSREFNSCVAPMQKFERLRQINITKMSEAFARQIHRDLVKIQSGSVSAEEIVKKYQRQFFSGVIEESGWSNHLRVDRSGFSMTTLGFYLQLKSFLQKGLVLEDEGSFPAVDPALVIDVPSNLKELDLWKSPNVKTIDFVAQKDHFVQKTIATLYYPIPIQTRFVYWFSDLLINPSGHANGWIQSMTGLLRLVGDTPDLSLKEALQAPLTMVEMTEYLPGEARVLEMMQMKSRGDGNMTAFEGLFLKPNRTGVSGVLDLMYFNLRAPIASSWASDLGNKYTEGEPDFVASIPPVYSIAWDRALDYYTYKVARGYSLFDFTKEVDALIEADLRARLKQDVDLVKKVDEAAAELSQKLQGKKLTFWRAIDDPYDMPLLSESQQATFKMQLNEFNRKTNNYFQLK